MTIMKVLRTTFSGVGKINDNQVRCLVFTAQEKHNVLRIISETDEASIEELQTLFESETIIKIIFDAGNLRGVRRTFVTPNKSSSLVTKSNWELQREYFEQQFKEVVEDVTVLLIEKDFSQIEVRKYCAYIPDFYSSIEEECMDKNLIAVIDPRNENNMHRLIITTEDVTNDELYEKYKKIAEMAYQYI